MRTGPRPKPPPKPTAHYPLAKVLPLVGNARVGRGRARDTVTKRLGGLSDTDAENFVRRMVQGLTEAAFVRTDVLDFYEGPIRADLYGVRDAHGDWYVKLYIEDATLLVLLSCHEPEGTLRRADGMRIGRPRK